MRPLARLAAAALVGLAAAGCGGGAPEWPPAPAEPAYGEDACSECRMLVSEARFAAQVRTRAGALELYDDLGCLVTRHRGAAVELEGVFVHDSTGPGWVRGDACSVARVPGLGSPMGSGLVAFATREAAESEAAKHRGATVDPLATLLRKMP